HTRGSADAIANHLAAMVGTVAGLVPESRRMVFLYVAAGAVFATIAARGVTVPLYAHDLGASRFEVGALFSVATIAAALLSLPSGLLVDSFGARTLLGVSLAATAISQLATAFTFSVPPLFLWQIVGGLAAGAQQSALFSAVTESVSRGRLGRAMGWLTLSMQVGFTLGPAIAGLALKWIDLRTDIAVTTALLIFTIPGGRANRRPRPAPLADRADRSGGVVRRDDRARSPQRFLAAGDRDRYRHALHGGSVRRYRSRVRGSIRRVHARGDDGHVRHRPVP